MGQEYITLFPIFLKSKNLASHQFCYSRLRLSTETVSSMSSVATDGKDGHRLKLEKFKF